MTPHSPARSCAGVIERPGVVAYDPNARIYEAFSLGKLTELKGQLTATNLEAAQAEATERWYWDRGDRLGIREQGQEDSPFWPFDKQTFDRLHIYAVQRSAPLRWKPTADLMRTEPVYRYSLKHICTIDLGLFRGEGFRWERTDPAKKMMGDSRDD